MNSIIKATLSLALFLTVMINNAQVTKSNNTQGIFLGSSGVRTINFDSNDFGSNPTIDQVTILIEFSSEDDGIFGFTFHEDLAFRLESPTGTTVDLVYDVRGIFTGNTTQSPTFGGFTPTSTVQVTFDDNASQSIASSPGGDPTSGTFVPIEPLSSFSGESPVGDWKLHMADSFDNGLYDQLFFFFASITITTPTLSLETNENEDFRIYPTVTKDNIHVANPNNIEYTANVYNVLGKNVWSSTKIDTDVIDVSSLEAGIYFVSIIADDKKISRKFIKK